MLLPLLFSEEIEFVSMKCSSVSYQKKKERFFNFPSEMPLFGKIWLRLFDLDVLYEPFCFLRFKKSKECKLHCCLLEYVPLFLVLIIYPQVF